MGDWFMDDWLGPVAKPDGPSAASYRHADKAILDVMLSVEDRVEMRDRIKALAFALLATALSLAWVVFALIGILEVFG